MGRIPKFIYAERSIKSFFASRKQRVYTDNEIATILTDNKEKWSLSQNTTTAKFIKKLIDQEILRKIALADPNEKRSTYDRETGEVLEQQVEVVRYLYGEPSVYEIVVSLNPKSYLSHYTAVYLNDLTTQIPKTIYLTYEQSLKKSVPGKLIQSAIDKAFSKSQRESENILLYDNYTIVLLNGKYTNRLGVYSSLNIDYPIQLTNIERTLIDIAVRPNYSGGPFAVLEAYRNAIDKISVNKFQSIYNSIHYVYPYHQAIGFYLEKAGYKGKLLDTLKKMPQEFKFYLAYGMIEKEYSREWNLYYPKGM